MRLRLEVGEVWAGEVGVAGQDSGGSSICLQESGRAGRGACPAMQHQWNGALTESLSFL